MATRRPRIKPVANISLSSKRKAKPVNDVKAVVEANTPEANEIEMEKQVVVSTQKAISNEDGSSSKLRAESPIDTNANYNNLNIAFGHENKKKDAEVVQELDSNVDFNSIGTTCENVKNITAKEKDLSYNSNELPKNKHEGTKTIGDSDAFKCPPIIGIQRAVSHTSNSGIDDVFYSDIEENALQMDLEKSTLNNCPLSPSKNLTRPRIRATPHFGLRRNSSSGNEENPQATINMNNDVVHTSQTARRERHHSASYNSTINSISHHHNPHKYLPAGITNSSTGRIRTESGCSVFSDTNTSSHKSRKVDDPKQNARKEFRTRFLKGVPEKSVIKMSDLIFYNPATNPMEQKPNPNVKSEQMETTSNDIKPLTEKKENSADIFADSEAVPVPQLKLNAKGELILDDTSLVIETTAEQEARKVLANTSLIYLDEYTGMNGFYSRRQRTRDWLPSDTIKFYRCLQNVGTDFSLMASLFPNRTRRDLKLKFKKEERKNGHLINKALLYPRQFDIELLKQQLHEEEKLHDEQSKKVKVKEKLKKEKKKKKINSQSKASRVLINAVYQNEINKEETRIPKTRTNNDKSVDIVNNDELIQVHDPVETDRAENVIHEEFEKKIKQKDANNSPKKLIEGEITLRHDTIENNNKEKNKSKHNSNKRWRKRRFFRRQNKLKAAVVKQEAIKIESKHDFNQTLEETKYHDTNQLEMEMDDLLDSDALDIQYGNETSNTLTGASHIYEYNAPMGTSSHPVPQEAHFHEDYVNDDLEIGKYEYSTFVNSDDGCISVISGIKDDIVFITQPTTSLPSNQSRSQSPFSASPSVTSPIGNQNNSLASVISTTKPEIINNITCSSDASERDLNEDDIQSILTELAEGSLVLVSTLDPDDPDKVLNEIYMVDNKTGELGDEPLGIPDNIVQCILKVVS